MNQTQAPLTIRQDAIDRWINNKRRALPKAARIVILEAEGRIGIAFGDQFVNEALITHEERQTAQTDVAQN